MVYEMSDFQPLMDARCQSVRMRTFVDNVASLRRGVVDSDPVTTATNVQKSAKYNPSCNTKAGSKEITGLYPPVTDNWLLWPSKYTTSPKSLPLSDNTKHTELFVPSFTQGFDVTPLTTLIGDDKSPSLQRTAGCYSGLDTMLDKRVYEESYFNKLESKSQMASSFSEQDSRCMNDRFGIKEAFGAKDNEVMISDNLITWFFNNTNNISGKGCSSSDIDVDTLHVSDQVHVTGCIGINVSEDCDASDIDCSDTKRDHKKTSICRLENESYLCKPQKRVTFGPDQIKYFDKRGIIDKELYLERKRHKRDNMKKHMGKKVHQVKTVLSKPFHGIGKKVRKLFSGSDECLL